jgi:hypothetical protein
MPPAPLLSRYTNDIEPWLRLPTNAQQRIIAAVELLTLEGRKIPLDGRAVIVTNRDYPRAAFTKVGETIRITDSDEITAFAALRRTMDRVYQDLLEARSGVAPERTYEPMLAEGLRLAQRFNRMRISDWGLAPVTEFARQRPWWSIIVVCVLLMSAFVAMGGGIYSAVPGSRGGVYLINKYTGQVELCVTRC